MIRLFRLFQLVRTASFSTTTYHNIRIDQFVYDFSRRVKLNTTRQCPIRSKLTETLDGFTTTSGHHPSSLVFLSQGLTDLYRPLVSDEKITFLNILAESLDQSTVSEYNEFPNTFSSTQLLSSIPIIPGTSPCSSLLYSIAMCREGLEFLLQIKTDFKSFHHSERENVQLKQLEYTIHQIISFWSRKRFLKFKHITVDSSNELISNLISSEAVHPIYSREEFARRVTRGMCFAVTHTQFSPHLPLSMIYCAPINYFPTHIQPLLCAAGFRNPDSLQHPSTACFYSISNAHPGFAGTETAHQLITHAVTCLKTQFPSIDTFLTLSPIPQFRKWLAYTNNLTNDLSGLEYFTSEQRRELLKVCAEYLVNAKKGTHAMDPVANFHLKNGALLGKINWLANPSERGMSQSFGIMANYVYELEKLELYRKKYLTDGIVSTSPMIEKILSAKS